MKRPRWCPAFLVALEACDGEIKPAADFTGISRRTVYHRMEVDRTFAEDVQAVRDGTETARVRAVLRVLAP